MKNVPVMMQMEATECGAASLAMVLASYGRWVPLEKMRVDCGVSRDGSNALNIVKAARLHGLTTRGGRVALEDLKGLPMPCILHWEYNHFVVMTGFRGGKYYLNDPARGRVKLPQKEVESCYSGVALVFEPNEEFVKEGRQASIMGFVRRRLKGAKKAFFITMLTGLLLTLSTLALPIFSQYYLDKILPGVHPEKIWPFFALLIGVMLYQLAVQLVQGTYENRLLMKLGIQANSQFLWHSLRLPMRFFSQRYVGDIITRMRGAESIPQTLVRNLAPVAVNVVLVVIYLVFMLLYSAPLSLIAIGASLVNLLVVRIITSRQVDISRVMERESGVLDGVTMSSIRGIETIKAAGAEGGFFDRWAHQYARASNARLKSDQTQTSLGAIPRLVGFVADNLILAVGAYYIMTGHLTVGMLMAFQGFMGSYMQPVNELINSLQSILNMRTQMERMEDVYRTEPDVVSTLDDKRDMGSGKLMGKVEMRNVTFGYTPMRPPLLKNFSLTMEPGHSVAFVGASGCGKSTLAKLISGLYDPWEGTILYDGKPRKEINRSVFVNSVAVIDQDVVLFDGTVADNVKMWDESIEDFSMILACNDVQMHEEIAARPKAYDTPVIENGKNFSGGQQQRLEIAAALAKEPTVLIMDEATSALDADTEQKVMRSIRNLGVSFIVIAHRLSTIRECDEIIVLDEGEVVERGTHEELMAKEGMYYELMRNA